MKKFVALLGLLYAPVVFAADDYLSLDTHYSNRYIAEGIVELDSPVYGLSLALDTPFLPIYVKLGTLQGGADLQIYELLVAYSVNVAGSSLLLGTLYQSEEISPGTEKSARDDIYELFLSYSTQSYNGIFFEAGYTYDIEATGGLWSLGIGYEYAISNSTVIGASAYSENNSGYVDIEDLDGFYHVDYSIFFQWNFLSSSGLELAATWISPIRNGRGRDEIVRDNVISFNLFFGL